MSTPLPPPGARRDSLIAERIMGWSMVPDDGRKNPPPPGTYQDAQGAYQDTVWSKGDEYHSNDAIRLLAWWVRESPAHRSATIHYHPYRLQWVVEATAGSGRGFFRHAAPSLSDAITAAILAASGVVG